MFPDSLIEKAKEKKLNPITRARTLKKLIEKFGLTTSEVAKQIGKSSPYVSNTIRLLTLPEALKDALISGMVSPGHARALAAIPDEKNMVLAYKQILRQEGSVRMAESLAREMKKTTGASKKKAVDVFKRMKREISQSLGGAKVDLSRSRVKTKISISLKGDDKKTAPWLNKIYQRLTKPNSVSGQ